VREREPPSLPPEIEAGLARAVKLEWWTIGLLLSISVVMALTMGNSQAMRTAWFEDLLSLIPPIAVLIALRFFRRPADPKFPYGYGGATSIAFLCAAVALTGVGLFLMGEALTTLLRREHPSMGAVEIAGHPVWSGWVMLAALTYSVIPPVILGRMKLELARQLHLKVLYTDAEMNRADWLTGMAAGVGVLGTGLGFWWFDAAAALLIALDVTRDGLRNVAQAVEELMDHHPRTVDLSRPEPVVVRVRDKLREMPFFEDVDVRLREEGFFLTGELYLALREGADPREALEEAVRCARGVDWRVQDVVAVLADRRGLG
jgi:divalent metal cation (Fe/Co/Zn/Cd) transporter